MKALNLTLKVLVTLCIALFFISLDVKLTLNCKSLFYFDMNHLKIEASSGVKGSEIKENYNYLIQYINGPKDMEFKLPTFNFSKEAKIHFEEVKKIFVKLNYLMYISLIISIPLVLFLYNTHDYSFIKSSSIALLAIPLALILPFSINFDKSFVTFHKIAFNNDYWEFNPVRDPIIKVLPQDFFFHCALMILLLIVLESALLFIVYKIKNSERKRLRVI